MPAWNRTRITAKPGIDFPFYPAQTIQPEIDEWKEDEEENRDERNIHMTAIALTEMRRKKWFCLS